MLAHRLSEVVAMAKRQTQSAAFKALVALAAVRGDKTVN
jgi:hypothetical protein